MADGSNHSGRKPDTPNRSHRTSHPPSFPHPQPNTRWTNSHPSRLPLALIRCIPLGVNPSHKVSDRSLGKGEEGQDRLRACLRDHRWVWAVAGRISARLRGLEGGSRRGSRWGAGVGRLVQRQGTWAGCYQGEGHHNLGDGAGRKGYDASYNICGVTSGKALLQRDRVKCYAS